MESRLELVCNYEYGKTNIKNIYFTPPYKIMHPFMDGEKMEVILMSSSAGLLAGDRFECAISVEENADVTFLSQSYEKILDTKDDRAVKYLKINVDKNASLKYLPFPAIPYANSDYEAVNEIHLSGSSRFVYSDVFSCGRVGMGERYALKRFKSRTKVYVDGELGFADHTLISPREINYESIGMWGDYTHNGMLYIYLGDDGYPDELITQIKEIYEASHVFAGVTRCKRGILLRTLGNSGEELYQLNKKIAEKTGTGV